MACGLQEESRHEEAIDAFREAIRLENPGGSDLYYNFGVSLSHLRRWEEAAGAYENAAQLDPSRADAWEGVGRYTSCLAGGGMRRLVTIASGVCRRLWDAVSTLRTF